MQPDLNVEFKSILKNTHIPSLSRIQPLDSIMSLTFVILRFFSKLKNNYNNLKQNRKSM